VSNIEAVENKDMAHAERICFLNALQAIGWWDALRAMTLEHEEASAALKQANRFMEGYGIVETWLKESVRATIQNWFDKPASPAAAWDTAEQQCDPTQQCFVYPFSQDAGPFKPVLFESSPKITDIGVPWEQVPGMSFAERQKLPLLPGELGIESKKDFEQRMLDQFSEQLKAYSQSWYRSLGFEIDVDTEEAALWTAMRLCGKPASALAHEWLKNSKSQDAEAMIRTRVRRFCERIELTIPNHSKCSHNRLTKRASQS